MAGVVGFGELVDGLAASLARRCAPEDAALLRDVAGRAASGFAEDYTRYASRPPDAFAVAVLEDIAHDVAEAMETAVWGLVRAHRRA